MECMVEGLNIHFEEHGEGVPLIMLHGWTLDHRHIEAAMEPVFYRRSGWRRIYPDMPGMGKTLGADWITTEDQMLDVLLKFVDAVTSGQRFAAGGSSWGGYIARGLAYRRIASLNGLLLSVPVIRADTARRTLPAHAILARDPALLAEMDPVYAQGFEEITVVQSRKLYDAFRADFDPATAVADEPFLTRVRENYAFSFDVDELPAPFPAPTLVLAGRQDSICGYTDAMEILENYPRGTLVVLDRAGHCLELEQEYLFQALVGEWLDRVEEYARNLKTPNKKE